jgi:hypothetical protein
LFLNVPKKVSAIGFFAFLTVIMIADLAVVDRRYFGKNNYRRKYDVAFTPTAADEEILKDQSYYRVYNLNAQDLSETLREARTSFFHNSLGGYHGAKMRRYQELYDSGVMRNTVRFMDDARTGKLDFRNYGVLDMLNTKYIVYGPDANNIVRNPAANGNAWFVRKVVTVNSPTEELKKVTEVDTREVAVIDGSRFKVGNVVPDSLSQIHITEHTPPYLRYESESAAPGLAVFSEIFYPKGWKATIDGKEVPVLCADYVLRALEVPAGKHVIEFNFEPKPYVIGNKVSMASSWVLLLLVLACLGWTFKKT